MASKQTQTALCFLLLFASEFLVGIAVQAESSETVIGIDLGPVKLAMEDARSLKKSDVHEIVLLGASTRILKEQEGVNPNEAVAHGAAIQGGVLSGESGQETDEVVLFEVMPFSLGIETVGGVMTKVIPRNSINPIMRSQVFTTYQDQQTTVTIQVYKGERALTKDCRKIGSFELSGIAPAPRGVPRIEVTFIVDANGILSVKAEDKATKKSESITITNNLSVEEIEEMIREAE